jgi:hypothetical protein
MGGPSTTRLETFRKHSQSGSQFKRSAGQNSVRFLLLAIVQVSAQSFTCPQIEVELHLPCYTIPSELPGKQQTCSPKFVASKESAL